MCTSTQGYDLQATHTVIALHIDPNPNSGLPTLLVAYENDAFFYRIRIGSQTRTGPDSDTDVDITTFGDPNFGFTSIVVRYFLGTAVQQASFILVGAHPEWVNLCAWDADNASVYVLNICVCLFLPSAALFVFLLLLQADAVSFFLAAVNRSEPNDFGITTRPSSTLVR